MHGTMHPFMQPVFQSLCIFFQHRSLCYTTMIEAVLKRKCFYIAGIFFRYDLHPGSDLANVIYEKNAGIMIPSVLMKATRPSANIFPGANWLLLYGSSNVRISKTVLNF